MAASRRKPITAIPGRSLAVVAANHYHNDLLSFLSRRLDSPHDVDDVAQSVYLKLVRIKDDKLVVEKPFGFVRALADRALSEFIALRSRERERTVSLDEVDRDGGAHEGSGGDPGDELAALEEFEAGLAQLSPALTTSFLLVEFRGLTYAQAAKRQGVTEHAVRKNVQRARTQIRYHLISDEVC